MELSPSQVCAAPGARATFYCSYRSPDRLSLEFHTSQSYSPSHTRAPTRDLARRYTWGATRLWTLVITPEVRMVTCRAMNKFGVTVGQMHARINTGTVTDTLAFIYLLLLPPFHIFLKLNKILLNHMSYRVILKKNFYNNYELCTLKIIYP